MLDKNDVTKIVLVREITTDQSDSLSFSEVPLPTPKSDSSSAAYTAIEIARKELNENIN